MDIKELIKNIEKIVPFENAFEGDNVGLVIGTEKEEVQNIIVSLSV